jgi:thiol-disulfide isomerase/thioredoxin
MFAKLAVSLVLAAMSVLPVSASTSFEMTDTAGRTHTLNHYQGKWVLVNLWATWCAPCLNEMPELESLGKARKDIVIIGLAVDGQNARRITEFARQLQITYPVVAGSPEMAKPFKPRGYPSTYLFDPMGRQAFVKEGPVTRAEIESLLGAPGAGQK